MANTAQAINNLEQTVSSFKARVDVKIQNVNTSTSHIRSTTEKIYDSVNRFKTDMMQGEEKQIAHENILRIDQIIKERFSNYETIRRTVMGVVRDFDINLVRNSTIQELSEELWITSSRYWLSYAMIAITAWVNDYPDVAKNALAESGRKDRIKTTLFFCLMNMRFNRVETAKKWFQEYLRTLDPKILQQETAVLLQSFLDGIFGKDKELEHEVVTLIDSWVTELNTDVEISEELISAYEGYIATMPAFYDFKFGYLQQYCDNAEALVMAMTEISKYKPMLDLVESLNVETEPQTEANYKARVDAILISLISKFDDEELELKNQQEYYRCIVENNGIIEKAEAQYQEIQKLQDNSFNIGKQMIHWAIYDDSTKTNVHVRKFAFQNTKRWFMSAVSKWAEKVQDSFPIGFRLNIDKWSGVSNGDDHAQQAEDMKEFFENNSFRLKYINIWNILAAIILVASGGLAVVTLYSLIFTGLSAAFLVYRILTANKAYPERVNKNIEILNKCMAELAECLREYEEKRNLKDKLLSEVEYI